jgi:tetratricopeptide (TPR) repeat protein
LGKPLQSRPYFIAVFDSIYLISKSRVQEKSTPTQKTLILRFYKPITTPGTKLLRRLGLSTQAQILILLLVIVVVSSVGAIWQFANLRGYQVRGRRRVNPAQAKSAQRGGDKRKLSPPEKKLYKEAQRMLREKKIPAAARIFEQLGMPREAIQCLEDARLIHEAASILLRMQRHNRAGVIFARHGMWIDAAQCFKTANMPAEAAKCFREAGDHDQAGTFFEAAGRFEDAAASYEQAGEFVRAARLLFLNNERAQSIRFYAKAGSNSRSVASLNIREDELDMLSAYVCAGNDDAPILNIITAYDRTAQVVLSLLKTNNINLATKLFKKSTVDVGPVLMADINYGDESAQKLAGMFLDADQHDYAGRVLERLEEFESAGNAFEKAGDYERASYCFERSGNKVRAKKLKAMNLESPQRLKYGNNSFALANVTENDSVDNDISGSNEEEEQEAEEGNDEATAFLKVRQASASESIDEDKETDNSETNKEKTDSDSPKHTEVEAKAPIPVVVIPPAPVISSVRNEPLKVEAPMPPPPNSTGNTGNFSLSFLEEEDASNEETKAVPPPSKIPTPAIPAFVAPIPSIPPVPVQTNSGLPLPKPIPLPNLAAVPSMLPDQGNTNPGSAAFHRSKFFADLDYRQKNKMWEIGKTQLLKADETILSYNDEPVGIYVILSGTVSCYKLVKDRDTYVDRMGEAESFGELWLLADQPTTVKFVASTETAVHIIDRTAFNDLLDSDGSIARKLYKRFTMRLLKRLLKPQNPNKNQTAS